MPRLFTLPAGFRTPEGNSQLSFPDETTDEQINAFLRRQFPPKVEEPSVVGEAVKGLKSGAIGLLEAGAVVSQAAAGTFGLEGIEEFSANLSQSLEDWRGQFSMHEALQGNIHRVFQQEGFFEAAKFALDPERLAFQIGEIAPTVASLFIPGGLAMKGSSIAAKALKLSMAGTKALEAFNLGLVATTFAGSQEGAQAFKEVIDAGGSDSQARQALVGTALATGALNAVGLKFQLSAVLKKLPSSYKRGLGRAIAFGAASAGIAGAVEGATEYLEEPAQIAVLKAIGMDVDVRERMLSGLDVILPSLITGGVLGGGTALVQRSVEIDKMEKLETWGGASSVNVAPEWMLERAKNFNKKRTPGREEDPSSQGLLGRVKEGLGNIPIPTDSRIVQTMFDPESPNRLAPADVGLLGIMAKQIEVVPAREGVFLPGGTRVGQKDAIMATKEDVLIMLAHTPIRKAQRERVRNLRTDIHQLGRGGIFTQETEDLINFIKGDVETLAGEKQPVFNLNDLGRLTGLTEEETIKFNKEDIAALLDKFGMTGSRRFVQVELAQLVMSWEAKAAGMNPREFFDMFVDSRKDLQDKPGLVRLMQEGEIQRLAPESIEEIINQTPFTKQESIDIEKKTKRLELHRKGENIPKELLGRVGPEFFGREEARRNLVRLNSLEARFGLAKTEPASIEEFDTTKTTVQDLLNIRRLRALEKFVLDIRQQETAIETEGILKKITPQIDRVKKLGDLKIQENSIKAKVSMGAALNSTEKLVFDNEIASNVDNNDYFPDAVRYAAIEDVDTQDLLGADPDMEIDIEGVRKRAATRAARGDIAFDTEKPGFMGRLVSKVLFRGLTNPDFSTGLHELFHFSALTAQGSMKESFESAMGKKIEEWGRNYHEVFSEAGEKYLINGPSETLPPALNEVFAMAKDFMSEVYADNKDMMAASIPPATKQAYDMLFFGESVTSGLQELAGIGKLARDLGIQVLQQSTYGETKAGEPRVKITIPGGGVHTFADEDPGVTAAREDLYSGLKKSVGPSPMEFKAYTDKAIQDPFHMARIIKKQNTGQNIKPLEGAALVAYEDLVSRDYLEIILSNEPAHIVQAKADFYRNGIGKAASSYRSNLGREMRQLAESNKHEFMETLLQIDKENLTNSQKLLLKKVLDSGGTDTRAMRELYTSVKEPRVKGLFRALYYESLLANPTTQGINISSTGMHFAFQIMNRFNAGAIDSMLTGMAKLVGNKRPQRIRMGEGIAMFSVLARGFWSENPFIHSFLQSKSLRGSKAKESFWQLLRGEEVDETTTFYEEQMGPRMGKAFEDLFVDLGWGRHGKTLANFLHGGTRIMRASDRWFKALAEEGERQAMQVRMDASLNPEATLLEMIEEELIMNPDPQVGKTLLKIKGATSLSESKKFDLTFAFIASEKGKRFAELISFQDAQGEITRLFQTARNKWGLAGTVLFPFITTGVNIAKRGAEITPGLGIVAAKFTRVNATKVKKMYPFIPDAAIKKITSIHNPEIWASQLAGVLGLTMLLAAMEDDDRFTGAPPKHPTERDSWYREGNIPYSFLIPFTNTRISWRNFEPFGTPLAVAVDVMEEMKVIQEDLDDPLKDVKLYERVVVLAKIATDEIINTTYMQGFMDFGESDASFAKRIGRIATSMIPYSSLMRSIQKDYQIAVSETGEVPLEETSIHSMFGQVLPFFEGNPRIGAFGPIQTGPGIKVPGGVLTNFLLNEFLPFPFKSFEPNPVETAFQAANFYPGVPTRTPSVGRGYQIKLDEDIHGEMTFNAALKASQRLLPIVQTSRFNNMSEYFKKKLLRRFWDRAVRPERRKAIRAQRARGTVPVRDGILKEV